MSIRFINQVIFPVPFSEPMLLVYPDSVFFDVFSANNFWRD